MSDCRNHLDTARSEVASNKGAQNTTNWSDQERKDYEAARAQAEREQQARTGKQNGG